MIEWLFGLDYYHWILFGLMLLIAEVFVGGSFLMWIGFSALVLGLLLLLLPLLGIHLGWEWQLVLFGIGALMSLYLWRRYMKDERESDVPGLNQRGADLVGRVVSLHDPIINGEGTIIVHDTHWQVSGPDMPAGTRVRLLSLDSMVFRVEKADSDS